MYDYVMVNYYYFF